MGVGRKRDHPKMASYSWELLYDPSLWLLLVVVMCTIFYGAVRSLNLFIAQLGHSAGARQAREAHDMKPYMAVLLPIIGSVMLMVLFFFLDWLGNFLIIVFAISSFISTTYALNPMFDFITQKLRLPSECQFPSWCMVKFPTLSPLWSERFPTATLMGLPLAFGLVLAWILTEHWLLIDILGLCLGVMAMGLLRLPNLMIATIILWLFFFYDIFWVFFSALFFQKNVMVHVATHLPSLPIVLIIPRIINDGYSLLGMGDIILPGLYLAFLYRFDYSLDRWKMWAFTGYFRVGLISYAIGFIWTYVMLIAFGIAQPALLYLVPSVMIPTVVMSLIKREFLLLWRGSAQPHTPTTGLGAEPQELEEGDLPSDNSSPNAASYSLVDEAESAIEIEPQYSVDDETDADIANRV